MVNPAFMTMEVAMVPLAASHRQNSSCLVFCVQQIIAAARQALAQSSKEAYSLAFIPCTTHTALGLLISAKNQATQVVKKLHLGVTSSGLIFPHRRPVIERHDQ